MMGGGATATSAETVLATVQVTDDTTGAGATALPTRGDRPVTEVADLRGEAVDGRRTITFTMGMGMGMGMGGGGGMTFGFDGQEFDPERVDQSVGPGRRRGVDDRKRVADGPPLPPARVADAGRGRRRRGPRRGGPTGATSSSSPPGHR